MHHSIAVLQTSVSPVSHYLLMVINLILFVKLIFLCVSKVSSAIVVVVGFYVAMMLLWLLIIFNRSRILHPSEVIRNGYIAIAVIYFVLSG